MTISPSAISDCSPLGRVEPGFATPSPSAQMVAAAVLPAVCPSQGNKSNVDNSNMNNSNLNNSSMNNSKVNINQGTVSQRQTHKGDADNSSLNKSKVKHSPASDGSANVSDPNASSASTPNNRTVADPAAPSRPHVSSADNFPKLSDHRVDDALLSLMRAVAYLSEDEKCDVLSAGEFGDKAHINDWRKSGEPYITHPLAVAEILAGFRLDRDTIIAAILHDTVEDTAVTHEDIVAHYGVTVARLVDGVTKLKSSTRNKQQNKAATFHKIISATLDDPRVLIIKLADRLHNMSTLDSVRPEKQVSTAQETLDFYVPFARLMGLNDIADYIEILCYRNIDPVMYNKMSDKLLQHGLGRKYQKDAIQQYLNYVLDKLELAGHVRVLDNQVVIHRQFYRNRGEINDLLRHYSFEVVTHSVEDCDLLANYLIKRYHITADCVEDNVRHPLPGGNQSLTLTYRRENDTIKVIILTEKMQDAARLGVIGAEHASEVSRSVIKASLRNMQEMIDSGKNRQDNEPDYDSLIETIDELTSYLNARKILCYSPKGRAYELPRGATALDFAYAVGPKVGNIAVGANIDGQEATLGSILKAGQTVAITVDKHAKPKAEWLGIVVTSKASQILRRWFRELPAVERQEHGRLALDRALRTYGKSLNDISAADWLDLLHWQNSDTKAHLFEQISTGNLLPQLVVSRLFSDDVTKSHANAQRDGFEMPNQLLANANGVEVHFPRCCNPIFGDPVIGHLTAHGLVLHRHKCYSILNKQNDKPYEFVQLNWHSEAQVQQSISHPSDRPHFTAYLQLNLILNDEQVSHIVYSLRQLSIGVQKIDTQSKTTVIHVTVRSRSHLKQAITALRPQVGFGSIRRLYRL